MTDIEIPLCPKCHCQPYIDVKKLMVICENCGVLTAVSSSVESLVEQYKKYVDRCEGRSTDENWEWDGDDIDCLEEDND